MTKSNPAIHSVDQAAGLPEMDPALVVPGLALILVTLAMLAVVVYPHF